MAAVTLQEARPERSGRPRRGRSALALALLLGVAILIVAQRGHRNERGGPPASVPGYADLWNGRATLVLDKKWTSESLGQLNGSAYAGAHVEVVGDTWYLFNRRMLDQPCAGRASGTQQMATQVRSSTDRGGTWGAPTTILAPTAGTPWACAATDGDAFYDAERETWGYLFQCLGAEGGWHGCYAERSGRNPMGAFIAPDPDPNPVITPGLLWDRICADAGDECRRAAGQQRIVDEGTFNVFYFDGGGWWVGFHGFDGKNGFRGIARSRTFRRAGWQVDGKAGTPTDAVIDAADAAGWRESWQAGGPIGPGAASIVEQDGWFYQLAELPDIALTCTPGQSWDLGLFRTRDLSSTSWQQYPNGNPLVYSSRAPEADGRSRQCNVPYPGLFTDASTGVSYVLHGRASADPANDALHLYRVEWTRNLLTNGDFARGFPDGWQALSGTSTQFAVERLPDGSPDGTPYLGFSCGAPTCDGGQSVYQDVPVDAQHEGRTLAFGGAFRSDAGAGSVDMSVLQLDDAGKVILEHPLTVATGDAYVFPRGSFEVDGRTRRLRFELRPRTSGMLRADRLYLIPQDGCSEPRYPAC